MRIPSSTPFVDAPAVRPGVSPEVVGLLIAGVTIVLALGAWLLQHPAWSLSLAMTGLLVWIFHSFVTDQQIKQRIADDHAAAMRAEVESLTANHGLKLVRRQPIISRPVEVACARGCGRMGTPGALGYDPYIGHVCRQDCRAQSVHAS